MIFGKFGPLFSVKVDKNNLGCYATVFYDNKQIAESQKAAAQAVKELNGKEYMGKKLYVAPLKSKEDREEEKVTDSIKQSKL